MVNKDKGELECLLEAMVIGDGSQAILNQEKRGQTEQAAQETLPRNMDREQFEALGFVIGEPVDDLFVVAAFPVGWKKVPTSHSMHTDLVDDKGRVRGNIFYKAAFYDRSAAANLNRRYSYGTAPVNGYGEGYSRDDKTVAYVSDQGKRIWQSDPVEIPSGGYELDRAYRDLARIWVEEHYPNHKNVLAYWDED